VRTIQLYATGSATATSVASVTIPAAGRIVGVQVGLAIDSITDGGQVRAELSKVPTNQIASNGALDPFLEVGTFNNFVTSGMANPNVNAFFPVDITVRQGEIIYLHVTVAGTATYFFNAILHYR
jgi:hypothetical protein